MLVKAPYLDSGAFEKDIHRSVGLKDKKQAARGVTSALRNATQQLSRCRANLSWTVNFFGLYTLTVNLNSSERQAKINATAALYDKVRNVESMSNRDMVKALGNFRRTLIEAGVDFESTGRTAKFLQQTEGLTSNPALLKRGYSPIKDTCRWNNARFTGILKGGIINGEGTLTLDGQQGTFTGYFREVGKGTRLHRLTFRGDNGTRMHFEVKNNTVVFKHDNRMSHRRTDITEWRAK